MRILIIEDEFNLVDAIKDRLKKEKYLVDIETDGEEGLYTALNGIYDLIILDVMLPSINGFEILKRIRNEKISSKVIMLTARSSIEDKLNGFEEGANDYLSKPFHMDELVARINVQLKNAFEIKNENIEFGNLFLNIKKSTIKTNCSQEIELVCKEFQLLEYFMQNPNQILSKEQIYDKVWGLDNEIESNNLEAYLSFIRKKLKAISSNVIIKSVRGLGYKMEITNEEFEK